MTWVRLSWRLFLLISVAFMMVVILGAGYWTWTTIADWRVERKVSLAREWPSIEISVNVGEDRKERKERADALKASVKARCEKGVLYYILTVSKNDAMVTDKELEELVNRISEFDIELLDHDGFKVSEIRVPRKDTTRLLGKSGESRQSRSQCVRVVRKTRVRASRAWRLGGGRSDGGVGGGARGAHDTGSSDKTVMNAVLWKGDANARQRCSGARQCPFLPLSVAITGRMASVLYF
jgi:hypothetical protein